MVVGVYHTLKVFDVGPVLELADFSSRHRLGRPRSSQPSTQPVRGEYFASIRQFRKLQVFRKRTVEVSDHTELRMQRQIEYPTKRHLVFAVQGVRPSEAQWIIIVGCEVGKILVLRLANEARERVGNLDVSSLHPAHRIVD